MTQRKALGKGLSSLIPERPPVDAPGVAKIDVGLIHPNPDQPRKQFDEEALDELAASIKEHGLLQPVVVSREGEKYRLLIGERRWRAAVKAGLRQMPALVREATDQQRLEIALVENMQRQGLNALEEARACELLVHDFGLAHDDVAGRLGKSRSYVSNLLRLLNLDKKVQALLEAGKLSAGHARALAAASPAAEQVRLAGIVVAKGLSVRQTEALVAAGESRTKGSTSRATTHADANVRHAEERLQRVLGAPVTIAGSPNKGRIQVEYKSAAELQRLYDALLRARPAPPPAAGRHMPLPGGILPSSGEVG